MNPDCNRKIALHLGFAVHFPCHLDDLLLFQRFSSVGWHRPQFSPCSVWCCRFAASGGVPRVLRSQQLPPVVHGRTYESQTTHLPSHFSHRRPMAIPGCFRYMIRWVMLCHLSDANLRKQKELSIHYIKQCHTLSVSRTTVCQ
jgi:hypothetical protein